MKCNRCNKEYPNQFIQPMFTGSGYSLVDPECALAITNEVHGDNRTSFTGTYAQQLLEDFREYKEKVRS